MHIQTIIYQRTFNLGNYSSEKIGVEFAINQGESANKALDIAQKIPHAQSETHQNNQNKSQFFYLYYPLLCPPNLLS